MMGSMGRIHHTSGNTRMGTSEKISAAPVCSLTRAYSNNCGLEGTYPQ